MAKKFNSENNKKNDCYYVEMFMCGCSSCSHCDEPCVGKENCDHYISGNDYFSKMLSGEIREQAQTEDKAVVKERIRKNLTPEKTKKQQKYEAKQEALKLGDGTGYTFMDDPRFKDLFKD